MEIFPGRVMALLESGVMKSVQLFAGTQGEAG